MCDPSSEIIFLPNVIEICAVRQLKRVAVENAPTLYSMQHWRQREQLMSTFLTGFWLCLFFHSSFYVKWNKGQCHHNPLWKAASLENPHKAAFSLNKASNVCCGKNLLFWTMLFSAESLSCGSKACSLHRVCMLISATKALRNHTSAAYLSSSQQIWVLLW